MHAESTRRRAVVRGTCAALVVVALSAIPAWAATYKWTDANGRVIYSDQPPPGNVKVESLAAPPPPANPNAAKELANKEAELAAQKKQRAEADAKSAKVSADANQRREQCGRVRGRILALQSNENVVLYQTNEKGEQVLMNQAARAREIETASTWIRQNCNNTTN